MCSSHPRKRSDCTPQCTPRKTVADSLRQFCEVADVTYVSDLVGELQEMQNASNTSTVAELLKQGAGRTQNCFCSLYFPERNSHVWCTGCSSHFSPAEAAWASYFSWVLVRQRICVFVNPDLPISFIIKLVTCCTWTQWKLNRWRAPRLFVRQPSVLWLWAHVQQRRWSTSRCPRKESLSRTAKDGTIDTTCLTVSGILI